MSMVLNNSSLALELQELNQKIDANTLLACNLCENPSTHTFEALIKDEISNFRHIDIMMGDLYRCHIYNSLVELKKQNSEVVHPDETFQLKCIGIRNKIFSRLTSSWNFTTLKFPPNQLEIVKELTTMCMSLMDLENNSKEYNEHLKAIKAFILQRKIFVNLCKIDRIDPLSDLDYFAKGQLPDKKITSLIYHCFVEGHIALFKLLATCGADVQVFAFIKNIPHTPASKKEIAEGIKVLLENGLDIRFFLKNLSKTDQIEIVEALIEAGVDVNEVLVKLASDFNLQYPLEVLQALIDAGANVTVKVANSTFHSAFTPELRERFRLLIYNGAPVNVVAIKNSVADQWRLNSQSRRGEPTPEFQKEASAKLQVLDESVAVREQVYREMSSEITSQFLNELSTVDAFTKGNPSEIWNIVKEYWFSKDDIARDPKLRKQVVEGCRKIIDYTST